LKECYEQQQYLPLEKTTIIMVTCRKEPVIEELSTIL